jgi:predicted RNase H-like HicB family nuclease
MATRDFKVFLEPDADYRGYAVVCRSIPGCYSQGRSQRLCQKIREAIEVSLEGMDSRDEQLPDPSEVLMGSVLVTRGARRSPVLSGEQRIRTAEIRVRFRSLSGFFWVLEKAEAYQAFGGCDEGLFVRAGPPA